MTKSNGLYDHFRAIISTVLLACLFLSLPEVDIIDCIFSASAKSRFFVISMACLGFLIILQLLNKNFKIFTLSLLIWVLYSVFILLSFIFNKEIVPVLFIQPSMIFCLSVVLSASDVAPYGKVYYYMAIFICFSAAVSLLSHLLLPFDLVHRNVFIDSTNSSQNIVLVSFSPSFYQFRGVLIPRMSAVFDEPGTFGFFVSIFGAFLYLNGKYKLARVIFFCGLASFSTAYLLFFALTIPVWLFDNKKQSIRTAFIISGVVVIFLFFMPEIGGFFLKRFVYAFSSTHNRSDGWSIALNSIWQHPLWGGLLSGYKNHSIHASGIIVVMAYIGVPAAIFLLGLSVVPILQQASALSFPKMTGKSLWVLIIAITITVANRNNFFNYSGFIIALFCIVAASVNIKTESHMIKIKK